MKMGRVTTSLARTAVNIERSRTTQYYFHIHISVGRWLLNNPPFNGLGPPLRHASCDTHFSRKRPLTQQETLA